MIMVRHGRIKRRALCFALAVAALGWPSLPQSQAREIKPAVKAELDNAEPVQRKRIHIR